MFSTRLECARCGAWYGRKTWASNTKCKDAVWQCNHKYTDEHPCSSATVKDEQIEALIAENQRCALDQDACQSAYAELDTTYRKTLARRTSLEKDIAANTAKHAAITTTLNDLTGEPVSEFHPAQWTALIDHAIVTEDAIRFVFRTGEQVRIALKG
ncbi:zinc ribbon domain-containing protein [Corynebacterium amycolatum]|uniref:zinc ribbon domain-containing protein n=1 Tax=Corynebacterium TaxID=1716 RepID=UPI002105F207|nr:MULTISPECIES: recombinase zinc beta ribbon domain-containing protein [Corynebacterium]MDK8827334.1 recombinase zinc beta ribbon domain-containing protein [Corynebacterium sp. MSK012]